MCCSSWCCMCVKVTLCHTDLAWCSVQKHHPDDEIEIGFTQQTPQPDSPVKSARQRLTDSPEAAADSDQHSPCSPSLPCADSSNSPRQPRQRHHMLRSIASRVQPLAEAKAAAQHRHGSRLALSLGDLDIPHLIGDLHDDLHSSSPEMELMSQPIKREPRGPSADGVLSNSLMLNSMSAASQMPDAVATDSDMHASNTVQTSECRPDAEQGRMGDPGSKPSSPQQPYSTSNLGSTRNSIDAAVSHRNSRAPHAIFSTAQSSGFRIRLSTSESHSPERSVNNLGSIGRDMTGPRSIAQNTQQPVQSAAHGSCSTGHMHGQTALQQLRVPPVQTGCPMQIGQGYAQGLSASLSPHALQVHSSWLLRHACHE